MVIRFVSIKDAGYVRFYNQERIYRFVAETDLKRETTPSHMHVMKKFQTFKGREAKMKTTPFPS